MPNEVTIREDKAVALYELETRFAMAVRQRELLETYIRERLKPNKHFYTLDDEPGRKPSLTKEGAELICLPHNLKPRYAIISGPESPPTDDTPFQITVNCELMAGDKFGGQGIGSASSVITKRDSTRVQRQKDPGLKHNATLKMACKSAYIAATLNATAASEFFTQDLEDDNSGSATKQNQSEHWCTEHNTAFFKRGKMPTYAHPIGTTGKWCNESAKEESPESTKPPTESKDTVTREPPEGGDWAKFPPAGNPPTQETKAKGTGQIEVPEFKTGAALFAWGSKQGLAINEMREATGVANPTEIKDIAKATKAVVGLIPKG